ncbi:uncharacterized protein LOC124429058 [Vespa crabro]|uniref:uncharacterized protein LOC124429058 n=1 Tax=Vespa crabro TaxID=7445 RepID=UPI001F01BD31|nr:uncharacterized protein LOC124429058 [Vespa crabro]
MVYTIPPFLTSVSAIKRELHTLALSRGTDALQREPRRFKWVVQTAPNEYFVSTALQQTGPNRFWSTTLWKMCCDLDSRIYRLGTTDPMTRWPSNRMKEESSIPLCNRNYGYKEILQVRQMVERNAREDSTTSSYEENSKSLHQKRE